MEEHLTAYFAGRASVRRFDSSRYVSDELLDNIFELAAKAPNTGNMQLYSAIVSRGEDIRKRLAELHFNQPAATGAPVLITFCADTRRFGSWCRVSGCESGLDNFGGAFTAAIDAAIFAQQFVTIAELNGLATCFLGTATYSAAGFCEALGMPEGVYPVLGLALGYAAEGAASASDRLPTEVIVHREVFADYTDEQIRNAYRQKENLPESKGFVAENDKNSLAQVYAEVRYPKALNEALGKGLIDLMSQG